MPHPDLHAVVCCNGYRSERDAERLWRDVLAGEGKEREPRLDPADEPRDDEQRHHQDYEGRNGAHDPHAASLTDVA